MKFEADAFIEHEVRDVFRAYRDQLPRLVQSIPQIRSITVESRIERDQIVELVNLWKGDSPIPTVAEKILPNHLTWHDHATWDADKMQAEWRIVSMVFPEAVHSSGTNRFVDVGGATRVEVRGEIRVDISKIRLPGVVAAPIAKAIERFFVRQFTPSLVVVCDAIGEFLDR